MTIVGWLKVFGVAVLIEVILVALSIAEVFIWSGMQNPEPSMQSCEAHANLTGPPLSAAFGALLMYFFTARYIKKNERNHLLYAIALPCMYLVVDVAILWFYPINWLEHLPLLVAASAPKYAGALIAYYRSKKNPAKSAQLAQPVETKEPAVKV